VSDLAAAVEKKSTRDAEGCDEQKHWRVTINPKATFSQAESG